MKTKYQINGRFTLDLSRWVNPDFKTTVFDFIEIMHNRGICIFSIMFLMSTSNNLFLIPLVYSLMFDLKLTGFKYEKKMERKLDKTKSD